MADGFPTREEVEAAEAAASMFVTVRRGDNLSTLAKRFGTTVDEFVKINGIANPDKIYTGQKFAIPGRFQITVPEPEELMAPEPPVRDPWNPAGIEGLSDEMIMAERVPTTQLTDTEHNNSTPGIEPSSVPPEQQSQTQSSNRSPTERVVDHFVRVYEEFANNEEIDGQKALFALDLLGVLLGGSTMTGRSVGKLLKQADTGQTAKTKVKMTHKEAIEAEERVAEGLKKMEPPQPTEAMKKRLETALRARKTPSTKQSFEEGLEWRGEKLPGLKNERGPKEREFKDIDMSRIPEDTSGKIDPEINEIKGMSNWVRDPVISAGVAGPMVYQSIEEGSSLDPMLPLEERYGILQMPEDNLKPETGPNPAIRNRARPHRRLFREEPAAE